jgi:hypothetical protein
MARAPSTFRQQDVTRAVKAVIAAGCAVARVVVEKTGNIVIMTAQAGSTGGGELSPSTNGIPHSMTSVKLQFIHEFRDRHGKVRRYFRRPGHKLMPLPGLPGSARYRKCRG